MASDEKTEVTGIFYSLPHIADDVDEQLGWKMFNSDHVYYKLDDPLIVTAFTKTDCQRKEVGEKAKVQKNEVVEQER